MSNILIADDDLLLGDLLSFRLRDDGHVIEIAENGQQALDMIACGVPDLLILDQMMPVVSGNDVIRRLKADERTREIPIIVLTARRGQDDVVNALQSGADDYITKPFMPEEVAQRVRSLLARRKG